MAKPVCVDGGRVGRASSITWGPSVDRLIGFGHLDKSLGEPGTVVFVDWAIPGTGTVFAAPATVSNLPFLQHRRTAG